MEPLRIVKMIIEVYNKEESPLHQIVKKLIYKKILDLEPYNFNYIYTSPISIDLNKKIYGKFYNSYDLNEKFLKENETKRKEIRENMTWNDSITKIITNYIFEKGQTKDTEYDPNLFRNRRDATTYIPLKSYKNKIFTERDFFLDGLKIIPDITLLDDNGKPETVIEILYTSLPKAEKLIKYIESDLNVIFVFADQAIETLATDMTCRRDYFNIPIREAWLKNTPKASKISRAVNIFLQKKLYSDREKYIVSKNIIKNTEWDPYHKWKKDRMNIGLKIKVASGFHGVDEKEQNLSHLMLQMKETSGLIILLRYMQKQKTKNSRRPQVPIFEGVRDETYR